MLPADASQATPARTISANMVAGALGGAAASAITQPLVSVLWIVPVAAHCYCPQNPYLSGSGCSGFARGKSESLQAS